jgi:hypothetical protein
MRSKLVGNRLGSKDACLPEGVFGLGVLPQLSQAGQRVMRSPEPRDTHMWRRPEYIRVSTKHKATSFGYGDTVGTQDLKRMTVVRHKK